MHDQADLIKLVPSVQLEMRVRIPVFYSEADRSPRLSLQSRASLVPQVWRPAIEAGPAPSTYSSSLSSA